jgi:hypothetical protein
MLKILALMTVATVLLVFNLLEPAIAQAQRQVSHQRAGFAGKCPIGSCAKDGGELAANVRNCSAANCKKPQAR